MRIPWSSPLPLAAVQAAAASLALAACGTGVSTSAFKGEQHAAAQAVANLQSDATASEPKKICANDLAAAVVSKLKGRKGCESAIKEQLAEIDNLEATVRTVQVAAGGRTATAGVDSIHSGKTRRATVSLVKEGGRWKVAALSGP